ncbi:MAG: GntR family transcriptional regulator [Micromonosporaceae bacterium]
MIDPDGPVPVYRQLANLIREQIESGEIPPDRPIPSAARLVQEHGVARGTALHAIRVLVDEGLVYVVEGKGTYVRSPAD